jgi:hypothetical protein
MIARRTSPRIFVVALATGLGLGCGGAGSTPDRGSDGHDGPAVDRATSADSSPADLPADSSPADSPADSSPADSGREVGADGQPDGGITSDAVDHPQPADGPGSDDGSADADAVSPDAAVSDADAASPDAALSDADAASSDAGDAERADADAAPMCGASVLPSTLSACQASCYSAFGIRETVCSCLPEAARADCRALLNCMGPAYFQCALSVFPPYARDCYCSNATCSQGANGGCAAQFHKVAGTTDPAEVLRQLNDATTVVARLGKEASDYGFTAECGHPTCP